MSGLRPVQTAINNKIVAEAVSLGYKPKGTIYEGILARTYLKNNKTSTSATAATPASVTGDTDFLRRNKTYLSTSSGGSRSRSLLGG